MGSVCWDIVAATAWRWKEEKGMRSKGDLEKS